MTPKAKKAMLEVMAAHALWAHTGKVQISGRALMNRLTDAGNRPTVISAKCVEERVEAAMMTLAGQDLGIADCLRLEFGAGWVGVIKRRRLNLKWKESTTETRAEAMGLCTRIYQNRINIGLTFILEELTK